MAERLGLFSFADWLLTPEGAAVHLVERTAVIADVHLGYEWARGKAGDSIPAHSLAEITTRLDRLLGRIPGTISTLIVAGDLVESRRPCRRTTEDVRRLRLWLNRREVRLLALAGNHDPPHVLIDNPQQAVEAVREVAGWVIGHGHQPIPGERIISGHLHPVFRLGGLTAPCFLVSTGRILLPAFSNNAAGLDILSHPEGFDVSGSTPRCLVSTGDEILDFGSPSGLFSRSRSSRPIAQGRRGG